MSAELHVIFGAGQVGSRLAGLLLKAKKRVRVVKRSAGELPPGVELLLGDAADPAFCIQAAAGSSTIYHCMNPPYYARVWASLVPRYMDNLILAAARAGARLVVLDNVYMLGRPVGRVLDEETPINPCSRKGEIRARAAERMFEAHRRGDMLATTGRASDFYGPGGTLTHLGDQFWRQALKRKTARVLVNPDAVHTYHYIPDVAAGLAVLGTAPDDVYGKPWMLPCAPAGTLRDLVGGFSQVLGREIRVASVPRWMVTTLAVVVPLLGEIGEMQYQWDEPFVVSDRRFRERFGLQPEAPDVAAAATIAWAKQHYA
ncbi:MAG TPA: NAD-dependent epimerase/dehydratase family protein [Terriglobia bacterium]|nr:NAD-dependent epimerase/dehydratase family protein [Terriglobia bacterium]